MAADTEAEVLVACGTPERGFPLMVGHVSVCCGQVFLQKLGATNHTEFVSGGGRGMFRVILSHNPAYDGGLTAGPGLHGDGLLFRICP